MWHSKVLSQTPKVVSERIIQAWLGGVRAHFGGRDLDCVLRGNQETLMTKHCHLQVVKGMGVREHTGDGSSGQATGDLAQVLTEKTKRSWARPQMANVVADVWMNAPVNQN